MEVHSCVAELTEARELLKLQTDAGLGEEESLTTMFNAWQSKMRTLKTTSLDDKKAIIGAVRDGPWSMDQRVVLIRIVMGGNADGTAEPAGKRNRKSQTCLNYENLLTESEWAALNKQGAAYAGQVGIISLRGWLCGIDNPSEPTLYRMASVLAYVRGDEEADQERTTTYMAAIQEGIKKTQGAT